MGTVEFIQGVDKSKQIVSVITAAFNSLATLPGTVASVRKQVGVGVEHIVVDGGSKDGTADWLKDKGNGLVWLSEPDEGIGDAMNKGARLAGGEWLLFLQADDWLAEADSLSRVLSLWDGSSELIACPIQFESGRVLVPRCDRPYYRWFKQGVLHQGALIRKSAFLRIGEYDTRFRVAMDYDWFLRGHRNSLSVQILSDTLAIMGEEGVSSQDDWPSLRRRLLRRALSN